MTAPAMKICPTKEVIATRPPRLNERILIGRYSSWSSDFEEHCKIIRKCGLVAEVEAADSMQTKLYAARRRPRNKHD